MTNEREKCTYMYFLCYVRQDKRHVIYTENTMTQPVQNQLVSLEYITDGTNPFYNTPGVPY